MNVQFCRSTALSVKETNKGAYMDENTASETASLLYSTTTALLSLLNTTNQAVSQDEVNRILEQPGGKLSAASTVNGGKDRAAKLAASLQENLFPSIPEQAKITGVILVINYSGDMTTEEYLLISEHLLGKFPEDIHSIFSLCQNDSIANNFKGTLLVTWET